MLRRYLPKSGFEPRKLIAACMAALGLGLASMAYLTPHLPQLYLTAVWIGVAGSGTYQLGYARIIATWFERRLGAALSILVAGSSIGSLLIPPMASRSLLAGAPSGRQCVRLTRADARNRTSRQSEWHAQAADRRRG